MRRCARRSNVRSAQLIATCACSAPCRLLLGNVRLSGFRGRGLNYQKCEAEALRSRSEPALGRVDYTHLYRVFVSSAQGRAACLFRQTTFMFQPSSPCPKTHCEREAETPYNAQSSIEIEGYCTGRAARGPLVSTPFGATLSAQRSLR